MCVCAYSRCALTVCVSEPLLSMHTPPVAASPEESYCFVAITTGTRRSRGQPSRKRRHSGLRCISGKCLNCARSPSDVFFDDRFVTLATRNPSNAITSLVAASGSNPKFRHGTSIDPPTPGLKTLSIAYKFVLFILHILHYNC